MRLARNYLYLSGAKVASKDVIFLEVAHLARVARLRGYGYLEFAGSVLPRIGLIVDQGFGPHGARETATAPQRQSRIWDREEKEDA